MLVLATLKLHGFPVGARERSTKLRKSSTFILRPLNKKIHTEDIFFCTYILRGAMNVFRF